MIVGLIFLIQVALADELVCPAHIQGKSGGNLSVMTKDFGPFDSKKCLLEQVGDPQNCKCEGQEKVFAESSLIDADNLYKQAIEEATEDAYIKSYQSAIKRIFQGALAADVYLKDKKLKEEDLIRLNSCRPNAVFETIKDLEKEAEGCMSKPHFKRRLAKFVGSRQMNLIEAEADKKDLAKKSINEIIESGKNAFYGQIIAVAQNVPTDPKYCVPYKAYLEFTKGDSPAGESWQDLTHPTNQSDYGMPEGFPFKGSLYQMDLYNSEDQIIKDYLSKGDTPSDDFGFMKGMDFDEPKADSKELIDNQIKREMRRIKAIERHPFLATILGDTHLKEEYEKFAGNEDTAIASENGIIKDAAFMKKIMEVQNKKCGKVLDKDLVKKLLCDELPKPSKEVYAAKILPSLYRDRENYPLPGLSYALVKKYNDNYCPRKPSRPGAPVKTDVVEENIIEKVLSPLTSEMSGLELIDSPFANESGYAKFNEKMCSSMKKCGKSGKCDSGDFWSEDLASQLLDKISKEKLEELAKEKGVDVETLKKQLGDAISKSLKSRVDDEEDDLLAEIKDIVGEDDEELVDQIDVFVRYNQRQNMKFPKESVATMIASCKEGDKCNDPNYWGDRTGREIFQKLSDQDKTYLSKQFNIPPEKLEEELIKSMQGKFNSGVAGKVSTSDITSDLGLQALGALEVRDENTTQGIRDLLSHAQDKTSQGLKIADILQRDPSKDTVSLTGLLVPESDKTEGRSINLDYAINGDKKDQTALEELAPVLAERDRNPLGIQSPIELPFQRKIQPAPSSPIYVQPKDGDSPIADLPDKKPTETPIVSEKPSGKSSGRHSTIERSSSSIESIIPKPVPIVDSKGTIASGRVDKRPSSGEVINSSGNSDGDSALDDAIRRAKQTLEDYKKAQASAGKAGNPNDDPRVKDLANEIERLRREKENNKKQLENLANSANSGQSRRIASADNGNGYGNIGGIGRQANTLDPRSLPPTRVEPSNPVEGDKDSSRTSSGVGHSSGGKEGGKYPSVSPKGSMSSSQAAASLRGKGVLSGDTLLEFEFPYVISHQFLFRSGTKADMGYIFEMLEYLGLEAMDFKTVEKIDDNGEIKYLVRFFSFESPDESGTFFTMDKSPLKKCKAPFEDSQARMSILKNAMEDRELGKFKKLKIKAMYACISKEVVIGDDEYDQLEFLSEDRKKERALIVSNTKSRLLKIKGREPVSEIED